MDAGCERAGVADERSRGAARVRPARRSAAPATTLTPPQRDEVRRGEAAGHDAARRRRRRSRADDRRRRHADRRQGGRLRRRRAGRRGAGGRQAVHVRARAQGRQARSRRASAIATPSIPRPSPPRPRPTPPRARTRHLSRRRPRRRPAPAASKVASWPREGGAPIAGATVTLLSEQGAVGTTLAAEDGAFAFADVAPGPYKVRIEADGFSTVETPEAVTAGEATAITYRLDPRDRSGTPVRVRRHRQHRRAAARGGEANARARRAGAHRRHARRSAARDRAACRASPARPASPGFIIIRGASPFDSQAFFEGGIVDRIYHFGGLTSFVNPRLLDHIDLYPGNFSARFGRKMGGIIDVGIRDPKTDGVSRHGRRQPDRRVLHRRGAGRQARRRSPSPPSAATSTSGSTTSSPRTSSASPPRPSTTTTRRSTPTAPRAAARCGRCSSARATSSA